jgi:hypothetical protein
MTLTIKGKDYPVTAKFRLAVLGPHPQLAVMNYGELAQQKKALLDLSSARHNYQAEIPEGQDMDPTGNLTVGEAQLLANITHVMNCHHAVNFLAGRDYGEFGFEGIDQVHGNRTQHLCGCVTQHVFDHHKAREPWVKDAPALKLHPHYSRAWCDRHKGHKLDFRAHYAAVRADPINNPKPKK